MRLKPRIPDTRTMVRRAARHGSALLTALGVALSVGLVALLALTLGATPVPARAAGAPHDAAHDDRGRVLASAQAPRRIISLLPSLTEAVCALGDCERLVGVDRYSDFPARVQGLPRLGGLDDAQVERIVALKPDLVLASPSARVIERLEGLGLRVLALEANDLGATHRVLQAVALALGRPGEGERLWQGLDRQIQVAAARVPTGWRGRKVYFEVATTPYAAGESSFIGELLARLGLGNIVPAKLGPFPQLNPEFIVRAQPAVVMADAESLRGMAARPGWGAIKALQQQRACGFAPGEYELLVRPGPRLGEAAAALADCLGRLAPPEAAAP